MEKCFIEHSTRKKPTGAIPGYCYTPISIAKSRAAHLQMLARPRRDRNLEVVSPRNGQESYTQANSTICLSKEDINNEYTNKYTKVEGINVTEHHPRQNYKQLMIAERGRIIFLQR